MTISKIRDKITNSGDFNGSATITHHNDFVECVFHLIINGNRTRRTSKYKYLDFDIPVNLKKSTILTWDKEINNGFGCKYINYYDERS